MKINTNLRAGVIRPSRCDGVVVSRGKGPGAKLA